MQKDSYRMRLEWKQRIIGHYYELEEDREIEPRERDQIIITEEETMIKIREDMVEKEKDKAKTEIRTKTLIITMKDKTMREANKTEDMSSKNRIEEARIRKTMCKNKDKKQ